VALFCLRSYSDGPGDPGPRVVLTVLVVLVKPAKLAGWSIPARAVSPVVRVLGRDRAEVPPIVHPRGEAGA
jgi:hypothetical protein